MQDSRKTHLVLAVIAAVAVPAFADADGPDFYRATGLPHGDALNIRAAPKVSATKLGTIPPGGSCIRNLGCRGGLSFPEYQTLSPEEQASREKQNPRWCRIEYRGVTGWVAGRYLTEGSCP
jgi:hypothetical protein